MRVLVVIELDAEQKNTLESAAPGWEYIYCSHPDEALIASADVIIGNISPSLVPKAKKLKLFQLNSAGVDTYCREGILPESVVLTNATGAYGLTISEYMVASIIMLNKNLHLYARAQERHEWMRYFPHSRSIYGSTTLCIGAGDIGLNFCRRMKALGSYTIGVKRRPVEKPEELDELYLNESIDSLLPRADIVALCLPNTDETKGLMNRDRFRVMKKDAILINIGRGAAVCTQDLVEALQNGILRGAILDVTDPEPLPLDHPLWDMDNVILTPHISGGLSLRNTVDYIVRIAAHNLAAFRNGGKYENVIDRKTGYNK